MYDVARLFVFVTEDGLFIVQKEVHKWISEYEKADWNYHSAKCPLRLISDNYEGFPLNISYGGDEIFTGSHPPDV